MHPLNAAEWFPLQLTQKGLDFLGHWSKGWSSPHLTHLCLLLHCEITCPMRWHLKHLGTGGDEFFYFKFLIVKRANQTLGLIKRTFTRISRDTLPILFTTIVRPILEYGNVIWHPRFKAEAVKVEKVQRRATKLIPEIRHLSYQDRLKNLKMYSLQYRRIRGDMIEVYKLMNGLVNSDPAAFFTSAPHEATRGHHQKLYKQRSNTVLRRNSFSQRVVESWNSLPTSVISSSSITSFKIRLDKHWSSQHQMLP